MNDKEWEESLIPTSCEERQKIGRFKIKQNIEGTGKWTEWKESKIRMVKRPQVWYLMMADCTENTHIKYPTMPKVEIQVEALNNDSHFSQEETWIMSLNVAMLLSFFFYLGRSAYGYWKLTREESFE